MIEMGRPAIDLTGQRFGYLVVRSRADNRGQAVRWHCQCDCGRSVVRDGGDLKRDHLHSCGCQVGKNSKHGYYGTPTYRSWEAAKARCENPRTTKYENYGGRGITMYAPWSSDFREFLAYIGERPDGMTLDRIDPDGNYEPGNVRWADRITQNNNRRDRRSA